MAKTKTTKSTTTTTIFSLHDGGRSTVVRSSRIEEVIESEGVMGVPDGLFGPTTTVQDVKSFARRMERTLDDVWYDQ